MLTYKALSAFDDLLVDSLIGKIHYWIDIRKCREYRNVRGITSDKMVQIIRDHIVMPEREDVLDKMQASIAVRNARLVQLSEVFGGPVASEEGSKGAPLKEASLVSKMRKMLTVDAAEDALTAAQKDCYVSAAFVEFLQIGSVKEFLVRFPDNSQRAEFIGHAKRYFDLYHLDCGFTIEVSDRYLERSKREEACVVARRRFTKGETVKYLTGYLAELSEEEDDNMSARGNDFSVLVRKGKSYLMLGPARFVNHDCDANARLTRIKDTQFMVVMVLRPIEIGQEIVVEYSPNYFGERNKECLCCTCERLQRNGWEREGVVVQSDPLNLGRERNFHYTNKILDRERSQTASRVRGDDIDDEEILVVAVKRDGDSVEPQAETVDKEKIFWLNHGNGTMSESEDGEGSSPTNLDSENEDGEVEQATDELSEVRKAYMNQTLADIKRSEEKQKKFRQAQQQVADAGDGSRRSRLRRRKTTDFTRYYRMSTLHESGTPSIEEEIVDLEAVRTFNRAYNSVPYDATVRVYKPWEMHDESEVMEGVLGGDSIPRSYVVRECENCTILYKVDKDPKGEQLIRLNNVNSRYCHRCERHVNVFNAKWPHMLQLGDQKIELFHKVWANGKFVEEQDTEANDRDLEHYLLERWSKRQKLNAKLNNLQQRQARTDKVLADEMRKIMAEYSAKLNGNSMARMPRTTSTPVVTVKSERTGSRSGKSTSPTSATSFSVSSRASPLSSGHEDTDSEIASLKTRGRGRPRKFVAVESPKMSGPARTRVRRTRSKSTLRGHRRPRKTPIESSPDYQPPPSSGKSSTSNRVSSARSLRTRMAKLDYSEGGGRDAPRAADGYESEDPIVIDMVETVVDISGETKNRYNYPDDDDEVLITRISVSPSNSRQAKAPAAVNSRSPSVESITTLAPVIQSSQLHFSSLDPEEDEYRDAIQDSDHAGQSLEEPRPIMGSGLDLPGSGFLHKYKPGLRQMFHVGSFMSEDDVVMGSVS